MNIRELLKEIQNSDEATKKRWLIGVTAVSMVLIIGLWLVYIKFTVESFTSSAQGQESVVGFWQIFKNGLTVTGESIWDGIKIFVLKITGERTITIE